MQVGANAVALKVCAGAGNTGKIQVLVRFLEKVRFRASNCSRVSAILRFL
jgi:hypothetical protein